MILPTRAAERASGQRRPVPGNSPDGRKDYPDFKPSQESLRRSPNRSPRDPGRRSPAVRTTRRAEGPSTLRFLGMTESIGPMWFHNQNHGNLRAGCRLPLVGPRASVSESDGRSASCPSSSMSSGRLILDRVARQQSPSPLHRYCDHKTMDGRKKTDYHRMVTASLPSCLTRGVHPTTVGSYALTASLPREPCGFIVVQG